MSSLIITVQKRNGSVVPFDIIRISGAVHKAMLVSGEGSMKEAKELVDAGGKAVKEGVDKAEAEEIKAKLEAAGAEVELK